jgi:molybdopterin synthase sulfur carrier subunit
MHNLPDQVTVWIPALLRDLTLGQENVSVSGSTVREVIAALERKFPGIRDRLCSGHGLRPGIAVVVNSQIATLGLMQPVPENSEVHFLPAVSGG